MIFELDFEARATGLGPARCPAGQVRVSRGVKDIKRDTVRFVRRKIRFDLLRTCVIAYHSEATRRRNS